MCAPACQSAVFEWHGLSDISWAWMQSITKSQRFAVTELPIQDIRCDLGVCTSPVKGGAADFIQVSPV